MSFVLLVILGLVLWPGEGEASNFQELSERYFTDRSVDYARELLLKESYLSVLYQCTVEELKLRPKEGLNPALLNSPFWDTEPTHFDRDDPALASAAMADRYHLWVDFEDREYQRRLQIILDIRAALIEGATAAQKQRMFREVLEQALIYYGRQEWEIASLLFDRLLKDFDFREVDDILFYQSEVRIQLKQFDAALNYLFRLLGQCPNSQFRARSYDRATDLLLKLGKARELVSLYERYVGEGFTGDSAQMGGVHLRAAQADISLGHFQSAVSMLERVDPKSPHYLASRYFLADCLAALEQWSRAVDALTEMVGIKQGKLPYDRWRMLTDEARIKLAFIYYEREEYGKAAELFDRVKSNSPFYDRVLMGKAWIAFQLDRYEETIEKSEELLNFYSFSTEIYEAGSLAGYCYEQLDQKSTAMTYFFEVLEAGVGLSKLQTFLKERRRISDALAELQALEEDVFASNNERLFEDYKRARNLLELSLKRIGLAELLEVNAQMQSLVTERVLLDKLIREEAALEPAVLSSDDVEVMAEFLAIEDRIYTIMDHLNAAGMERLKSTPLYYSEARVGYINTAADSLSARLEAEMEGLIVSIDKTDKLYEEQFKGDQPEACMELGLRLDYLNNLLDQSYLSHTLSETFRRPVLKTRVDRWSDFSFNRYAMGGMEFDELERKYERLLQVEGYLMTLDEMIELRTSDNQSGKSTVPPESEESGQGENRSE